MGAVIGGRYEDCVWRAENETPRSVGNLSVGPWPSSMACRDETSRERNRPSWKCLGVCKSEKYINTHLHLVLKVSFQTIAKLLIGTSHFVSRPTLDQITTRQANFQNWTSFCFMQYLNHFNYFAPGFSYPSFRSLLLQSKSQKGNF